MIEDAATQGMTHTRKIYTPEEFYLRGKKKDQGKMPISEGEAEEFLRRMRPKYYSIVKHLEKNPAQISI